MGLNLITNSQYKKKTIIGSKSVFRLHGTGSEHQPVNGGAGPADLQRSGVREEHRGPDESGGREAESGL